MKRTFRYPRRALSAEYARGAIGLALCGGPVLFTELAPAVASILGAGAALFLVYFGRTVCRQLTHIELDEAGICARGPIGAAIRWEGLRTLRLDYYSTRSDREGGWMQLKLRDAQRTIRIESQIDGFAELALAAAGEALRRGLDLDESTHGNLRALGR